MSRMPADNQQLTLTDQASCRSTLVLRLEVPASLSAVWTCIDAVRELLERQRWDDDDVMTVVLALDEAVTNAVRHGCQGDPGKLVVCDAKLDADGDLSIVVRD